MLEGGPTGPLQEVGRFGGSKIKTVALSHLTINRITDDYVKEVEISLTKLAVNILGNLPLGCRASLVA